MKKLFVLLLLGVSVEALANEDAHRAKDWVYQDKRDLQRLHCQIDKMEVERIIIGQPNISSAGNVVTVSAVEAMPEPDRAWPITLVFTSGYCEVRSMSTR